MLIPFIDDALLSSKLRPLFEKLSPADRARNSHRYHLIWHGLRTPRSSSAFALETSAALEFEALAPPESRLPPNLTLIQPKLLSFNYYRTRIAQIDAFRDLYAFVKSSTIDPSFSSLHRLQITCEMKQISVQSDRGRDTFPDVLPASSVSLAILSTTLQLVRDKFSRSFDLLSAEQSWYLSFLPGLITDPTSSYHAVTPNFLLA
ncbi:unnamed protein product [Protopolystoma xenopodis]|uniref:Uncharacterized protein n=1 Tax=Protopolystoma xenopodis TaxID=117903 RepID=A0A448XHC3_9PLAT|nr:unnamed protein product [Protopolystoma xenopodis]